MESRAQRHRGHRGRHAGRLASVRQCRRPGTFRSETGSPNGAEAGAGQTPISALATRSDRLFVSGVWRAGRRSFFDRKRELQRTVIDAPSTARNAARRRWLNSSCSRLCGRHARHSSGHRGGRCRGGEGPIVPRLARRHRYLAGDYASASPTCSTAASMSSARSPYGAALCWPARMMDRRVAIFRPGGQGPAHLPGGIAAALWPARRGSRLHDRRQRVGQVPARQPGCKPDRSWMDQIDFCRAGSWRKPTISMPPPPLGARHGRCASAEQGQSPPGPRRDAARRQAHDTGRSDRRTRAPALWLAR